MYLYLKMAAKIDYCVKTDFAGKPARETERKTRQLDLGSDLGCGIWDQILEKQRKRQDNWILDLGSDLRERHDNWICGQFSSEQSSIIVRSQ